MAIRCTGVATRVAAIWMLAGGAAMAQPRDSGRVGDAATSPPSAAGASTEAAAPTTTTTVAVDQPAASGAPVVVVASAPVEDSDPVRFRFGIALDGNVLLAPNLVGLAIGLTIRAGLQFNQWVGVYYQPHGLVGGWITANALGVIAALYNSALIELTLPFVHIGAGPSFDILAVAGCGAVEEGSLGCISDNMGFFGIDGRLALVIGAIGRGSRGGFSINAHVHPTFIGEGVVTTLTLGIGGEVY